MFTEPPMNMLHARGTGWIEVITGCMFSGKTEELIRRLNRALIAKQQVEVFKPAIDTRYHQHNVVSHNATSIHATPVPDAQTILTHAKHCHVVGIDEGQFFDDQLVVVCNALANSGKRVIVAGLDMDYEGRPFGAMPNLMAVAEFVTKVHAICAQTGGLATYSHRIVSGGTQIMPGAKDLYEARSRSAFFGNNNTPD